MAFRMVVSDRRLKLIFNIEGAFELAALKSMISEDFLNLMGRSRPRFLGNLVSKVEKENLAFWVVVEKFRAKACVDVEIIKELERRNAELLVFAAKLVEYSKDKKAGRARFKVPNIATLTIPFTPISTWWLKLRAFVASSYDFLWCTQANVKVETKVWDAVMADSPVPDEPPSINISMSYGMEE
ncbi:hypothetical protein KI387_034806 [Taxus chinensis]|uniref:Uncharacterized protein n=1 Tax=Taxus chinensis TaxID=29808 RepID=A0AA38C5J1_TAXCH|nr:hypothetical protein KI387_034806 [Taxus chinensis]